MTDWKSILRFERFYTFFTERVMKFWLLGLCLAVVVTVLSLGNVRQAVADEPTVTDRVTAALVGPTALEDAQALADALDVPSTLWITFTTRNQIRNYLADRYDEFGWTVGRYPDIDAMFAERIPESDATINYTVRYPIRLFVNEVKAAAIAVAEGP